ncbi:MAG TPA: HepT-like ribonuclease domain-containing protein [Stellaceae bacterium]|nr:HepT-like ribonuclease domain-containing protein [Stellaceae bacterium]
MVEAIKHIRSKLDDISLEIFQGDLDRRRIVERNVEIISEASRRLPDDLKDRHPEIPWKKVAGIGNVLRHDYENVVPDALWKLARDDLPALEKACEAELMREKIRQREPQYRDPEGYTP